MHTPRSKRRWLQFRIRTLLIAFLAFSVLFGWLAIRAREVARQRAIVADLEETGFFVGTHDVDSYPVELPKGNGLLDLFDTGYLDRVTVIFSPDTSVRFSNEDVLEEFRNLEFLELFDTQVSDISVLKGLTKLKKIILIDSNLSDLSALKELKNLENLKIGSNEISDVSALRGLKNLKYLNLSHTQVSDVSALTELEGLLSLHLSGTLVTDITELRKLRKLKYLDVSDTNVSKKDVEILKAALPSCNIQH